jgi:hypothetical protein
MFDSNRNTSKLGSIALVAVLLVSTVGLGTLAAGSVAATDSDASILVHESTAIDNSTDSVYADVTGNDTFSVTGPIAVTVTFTGHNESQDVANGTVLSTQSLSVAAGSVSSATYQLSDTETTDYDKVHVEVNVDTSGEETEISSTDWGVLQEVSGGGGGILGGGLGGSIGGIPIALVVLLVGGYVLMGDD